MRRALFQDLTWKKIGAHYRQFASETECENRASSVSDITARVSACSIRRVVRLQTIPPRDTTPLVGIRKAIQSV